MEDARNTGRRAGADEDAASETVSRRRLKPENEIPMSLAVNAVLGATDDVVVFISGMDVYSNGIAFTAEVRARPSLFADRNPDGVVLGEALYLHEDSDQRNLLLIGVEFADGRHCANIELGEVHDRGAQSDRPRLWQGSGGGDNCSGFAEWFLSPLPPAGDLRFICAWTVGAVPETVTTLSADHILSAASHARELWPPEPEPWSHALPHSPIPAAGWFAARASTNPEVEALQ